MRGRLPPAMRPPRRPRVPLRSATSRPGRWMPLAVLLLSLGVASVAIYHAQRVILSHQSTASGLIEDYGTFAAWSFRQHAAEELRGSFRRALDPVARPRPGREIVTPAGLLAASGGRAVLSFRVPLNGGAPGFAGSDPGPRVQGWIAETVRAHARTAFRPAWEFAVAGGRVEGRERLLVYTLAGPAGEGRTAYGFEWDPERHRSLFQGVLAREALLPAALMEGRSSTDLLAVQVLSPAGDVLFASDRETEWWFAGTEGFGPEFGGLRARATVRPAMASSLINGGVHPRSWLPYLAGLLLLACGLSVVAVGQLRREGELARLRSDFVSSVSHELRTPLAQVRLFLETLRLGRYRTEAQREWIMDNLDRETTRLTALVDNVLHFARAERGALGGNREPTRLAEYLEGIVGGFAPLAASRLVRLETRFAPGLVAPLHAESFRQVVLNLLDNAVKYGPEGQTVRVTAEPAADGRVRIAVEDQGPGIDPRERERIWEPFRRGERAIGSVAVGSGIGLAVVREIVEWHEGTARVEDAPGGGARFVLDLPGWRETGDATPPGGDTLPRAV